MNDLVKISQVRLKIRGKEVTLTRSDLTSLLGTLEDIVGRDALDPIHSEEHDGILVDPNSEYWPCGWHIEYGTLRQNNVLVIHA